MIVVYHHDDVVTEVTINQEANTANKGLLVTKVIPQLAKLYPNQALIWCHELARNAIDLTFCEKELRNDRKLISYLPQRNFFSNEIGYVEESVFINANKKVTYPTWQVSSLVGGMQTSIINQIDAHFWAIKSLDMALNTIAKNYQPKGLFCYSEPKLLFKSLQIEKLNEFSATTDDLFTFVAKNYKKRWLFLLVLNYWLYQRKWYLWLLFKNIFQNKDPHVKELFFEEKTVIPWCSEEETIDVVIPTIGRKKYLYDVLKDLSKQTHLPKNVIIVEQNPEENSISELDYLQTEIWPFQIKHVFTHQTGACQARNKALELVESKWVFLNDDDNRFEKKLIENAIQFLLRNQTKVMTSSYLQKHESKNSNIVIQWPTFGAGNTFVYSKIIQSVKFNLSYEYGYAEDADFGMQIRNLGYDIIYNPDCDILHLKATMGGFRSKPNLDWQFEPIAPKPSPTVMLYNLLHKTEQQLLGYKTILFFKYYFKQKIKNPWKYYIYFEKQWELSKNWATKLREKKHVN